MLYHTKGGLGWSEIYNMPTWLRRFYYKKLVDQLEQENEANERASKGKGTGSGTVHRGPYGSK